MSNPELIKNIILITIFGITWLLSSMHIFVSSYLEGIKRIFKSTPRDNERLITIEDESVILYFKALFSIIFSGLILSGIYVTLEWLFSKGI